MKVTIDNDQRKEIERLWFIYGNGGEKSNFAQHKFIQWILEQGEYSPELLKGPRAAKMARMCAPKNNFNKYRLSEECVSAVKSALKMEQ